jgi:hypothetical protein
MKFNQEGLTVDQIIRSLRAMISDGGFSAEYIIIDGYNFSSADKENISKIREFAQDLKLSVWFSCTVKGTEPFYDKMKIPIVIKDYADLFDVIVVLDPQHDHIALALSRNRDESKSDYPALRLDPKTLLILEDKA